MKKRVYVKNTSLPQTLPLLIKSRKENCPKTILQFSKDSTGKFIEYSYEYVYTEIIAFAVALKNLGIKKESKVGLISDNRREWLISDLAILSLGGADVPRGCDSTATEISFILSHVEAEYSIFENPRQLEKVMEKKSEELKLKTAIIIDMPKNDSKDFNDLEANANSLGIRIYSFNALLQEGKDAIAKEPKLISEIEQIMSNVEPSDVATYIYTSGTTGTPKGVMLTHRNYLAQLETVHHLIPGSDGQKWLTVLPVWHSFERVIQYIVITFNSGLAYSKPVGQIMLADMAVIKPEIMCGVPRLWETLANGVFRAMKKNGGIKNAMFKFFVSVGKKYVWAKEHVKGQICDFTKRSRVLDAIVGFLPMILLFPLYALGEKLVYKNIRAKLGGNFVAGISGGGALQPEIDAFYRAISFPLLEGYGMTETAPILSVRDYVVPRPGCVGSIIPSMELKVVPEEHGKIKSMEALQPGKQGLIVTRGDQVMKGYYKRQDLTDEIIDKDGWLNTGDLGIMTYDGEIKITGRAKDTIVLLGGENIEPISIEFAMCASNYIESAVLLGQDKKYLGALIVPARDAILEYAKENFIDDTDYELLLEKPQIEQLIRKEIDNNVNIKAGFRPCEKVFKFALLSESFKVGEELSGKQEYIRHKINIKYKSQIDSLFE